jgi:hypothetical protein
MKLCNVPLALNRSRKRKSRLSSIERNKGSTIGAHMLISGQTLFIVWIPKILGKNNLAPSCRFYQRGSSMGCFSSSRPMLTSLEGKGE